MITCKFIVWKTSGDECRLINPILRAPDDRPNHRAAAALTLSPLAARLKASLPSPALAWPCGQPTCTGQCQLCGISLRTGPAPAPPSRRYRPRNSGSIAVLGYVILPRRWENAYLHRM